MPNPPMIILDGCIVIVDCFTGTEVDTDGGDDWPNDSTVDVTHTSFDSLVLVDGDPPGPYQVPDGATISNETLEITGPYEGDDAWYLLMNEQDNTGTEGPRVVKTHTLRRIVWKDKDLAWLECAERHLNRLVEKFKSSPKKVKILEGLLKDVDEAKKSKGSAVE